MATKVIFIICHFEETVIYHIVVSNRHFVPTSDNSKGHSFRNLISNRKSYIKLYPLKVSSCRVLFSHFENNTDRADLHICRLPLGEKALTPIPSIHLYSPSTRLLGGDFQFTIKLSSKKLRILWTKKLNHKAHINFRSQPSVAFYCLLA